MHPHRVHVLAPGEQSADRTASGRDHAPVATPVIYWMHREHRARDNWGLVYAQKLALTRRAPLAVVYGLAPEFLGAAWRQFAFLLAGLESTARELEAKRIPFFLRLGEPPGQVLAFLRKVGAGLLVTDFDSLRLKRAWLAEVAAEAGKAGISVHEVDSRNVVPCRAASDKQEYAARTIRPKLHRLLPEFLEPIPQLKDHPVPWPPHPVAAPEPDFAAATRSLRVNRDVAPVTWLKPGEDAARRVLDTFLDERLAEYDALRNDPTHPEVLSDLSPYLHFGQLSAQRAVLELQARKLPASAQPSREAFLEQLVVRRELSDNFCLYNPHYDSVAGFPDWARRTLDKHANDPREYLYSLEEFERAATHDPLWNAAQQEMVVRGKMHTYMRMYWAKKILEWTPNAEEAMRIAITLNDRYELDGREANGYTGIAWSMGGVHDRPWKERPIYGTIRYMSASGARRKFDVDAYVAAQQS